MFVQDVCTSCLFDVPVQTEWPLHTEKLSKKKKCMPRTKVSNLANSCIFCMHIPQVSWLIPSFENMQLVAHFSNFIHIEVFKVSIGSNGLSQTVSHRLLHPFWSLYCTVSAFPLRATTNLARVSEPRCILTLSPTEQQSQIYTSNHTKKLHTKKLHIKKLFF